MNAPDPRRTTTRRRFLGQAAAATAWTALAQAASAAGAGLASTAADDLVESVAQTVVRRGSAGTTWFSARACRVPGARPSVLMTLQPIYGSDYFGQVHCMETFDLGGTWSEPQAIAAFRGLPASPGVEQRYCDVVPEFHPATRSVLAMGHNVFYTSKGFYSAQPPRHSVYAVRDPQGTWSEIRHLVWDDPRGAQINTCGCAQRVTLDNGDLLIPLSFHGQEKGPRAVATVRATFDGQTVRIREAGPALELRAGRGLLEPSLARLDGRYYLTLRAEDGRGYVSVSDEGLRWAPIQPWTWDDGTPLAMSTTQQRWLPHSDGLYLVYTRKAEENTKVVRWRAPLYMALVDRARLRLVRATERIAVPLIGDAQQDPRHVFQLGNFHTVAAGPEESWVTVGAFGLDFRGDLLLGRIRWKRPNRSL